MASKNVSMDALRGGAGFGSEFRGVVSRRHPRTGEGARAAGSSRELSAHPAGPACRLAGGHRPRQNDVRRDPDESRPARPTNPGSSLMARLGIVTYNIAKDWDLDTILRRSRRSATRASSCGRRHAHKVEVNLTKAAARRGPQAVRGLARRARRAGQCLRIPGDRSGRRPARTSRGPRSTSAWRTTSGRPA